MFTPNNSRLPAREVNPGRRRAKRMSCHCASQLLLTRRLASLLSLIRIDMYTTVGPIGLVMWKYVKTGVNH